MALYCSNGARDPDWRGMTKLKFAGTDRFESVLKAGAF